MCNESTIPVDIDSQLSQRNVYVSLGIFPGLFDRIQGLLSQKSSLIMSMCSTTMRAFALLFLSFSVCVLDCVTGSVCASIAAVVSEGMGSASSYCACES